MGMWTIRRARRSGSDNSSSSSGVWIGPGTQGVGSDALPRVLDRDLACHREHAPLARGIGDLRGGGAHDRDERRDVDDGAPTRREHRGDAGLAAEPHALQVDLHHAFPRRFGRVERAAVVRGKDAGVVVEDVQATEGVHRGLHHRRAVVGPGHVRADERGLAPGRADRRDDVLSFGLAHVTDDDVRAFGGEQFRGGAAHAACRTSDQCDLLCEPAGHQTSTIV